MPSRRITIPALLVSAVLFSVLYVSHADNNGASITAVVPLTPFNAPETLLSQAAAPLRLLPLSNEQVFYIVAMLLAIAITGICFYVFRLDSHQH